MDAYIYTVLQRKPEGRLRAVFDGCPDRPWFAKCENDRLYWFKDETGRLVVRLTPGKSEYGMTARSIWYTVRPKLAEIMTEQVCECGVLMRVTNTYPKYRRYACPTCGEAKSVGRRWAT